MILDILDKILGLLHSDGDYTTLETCSLVFPGQLVDRHLYSQITLDIVHGGLVAILPLKDSFYHRYQRTYYIVDPSNFLHILADRPHIANYVRLVQIIMGGKTYYYGIPQQLRVRLSFASSILSTLPHPESILVEAHISIKWHRLGSEFSTAFRKSVRLPSVKSVAIYNLYDISLDDFDGCKNLENLILDDSFLHGDSVSTSSYPRLRSLHIVPHEHLSRVVSWLRNSSLHSLSFRNLSDSICNTLNIFILLDACSTTLVNLDINHNYQFDDIISTIPDIQLPFLDHLTFRSSLDPHGWFSPLLSLARFLGSIKTISRLSPIRLTLHLYLDCYDVDWCLVTSILTLPIFRHPIEIYLTDTRSSSDRGGGDVASSMERNSDMKKFLEDGTFVAFMNEEWVGS